MPTRQAAPAPPPSPAEILRVPDLRGAGPADWAQLVRFCVVGASGYILNLAVFATIFHIGDAHHQVAALGAFAVAWCSNFAFNKYWTFRRHDSSALGQAGRYLAVSLVALALNLMLLQALVQSGLAELLAQAAAIAAVVPLNFLLNRRWSFR